MVSLPAYLGAVGIVALGVMLGVVQPIIGLGICVLSCAVLAGFYWALRSGLAARTKDPLLAFSQVIFGVCLVALGYALFDGLRSTTLLWLSVIIVFDMQRLPGRQVLIAAAICMLLLPLATVARATWHPSGVNWVHEIFTLLLLAVVLPALIMASTKARGVRKRQVEQKQQMAQGLEQLRQLSVRDGLTGLYNRRHMLDVLDDELRRWKRAGLPFCVAVLDLDWFKRVNDQFGHATGDAVLQTFAQLSREAFPDQIDVLARWGGEEFLLLQPQRTEQDAMAALARLQDAVRHHDWAQCVRDLATQQLKVSFSAGVCEHREGSTLAQTLERADQALYKAKAAGRDCVLGAQGVPPDADALSGTPTSDATPLTRPVVVSPTGAMSRHAASIPQQPSPTSASSPKRRPHPLVQRVGDVLMGTDPRVRPHQPMGLLAIVVYLACVASFLFYVEPAKLLTHQQTMLFVAHNLLGAFVPYTVVRMGWTAHWRDPACTVLQLMWAGSALIISHGLMPMLSATTLQMICLCVVYGFLSLRPDECRSMGQAFIAMILSAVGMRFWLHPANINPRNELLELGMTCLVLWILTLQSESFSRTRERVRAEKRELAETTEHVNQLLMHDPLTGLFNRQHMQRVLELECDRHQRPGPDGSAGFCLALIDLDHFKDINDTYGHRVGDEALIGFAKAAQAALRETDMICRWGGEEFLVLLAYTEPAPNAMIALNRLREHVATQRVSESAPQLQITFSAGLAAHGRTEPITSALERADKALYAAKAAGRNRCMEAA